MDREKLFEDFLSQCKDKERQEICGQGNPNADILIIGKEPHDSEREGEELKKYIKTNWERCRVNYHERKKELVTWGFYQDLIEMIFEEEYESKARNKNIIDFEELAYTTELSSMPRLHSNYSKSKTAIYDRLKFFSTSDFIKDFPIVILACGGYIKNNDKIRQIDDTFHVNFERRYDIAKNNWFCTHYNKENRQKQLVIHTRQLSRDVHPDLLRKIASVVREYFGMINKI